MFADPHKIKFQTNNTVKYVALNIEAAKNKKA